jgi:hypothetical protein
VIPFRGVKMGDIRSALYAWLREESISVERSPAQGVNLALQLLQETYCEDKLAGVLYLQEVLIPPGAVDWRQDLARRCCKARSASPRPVPAGCCAS